MELIKTFRRIFILLILVMFLTGFRIYPSDNRWNISISDPKIYLRFSEDMLPTSNDVPSDDTLFGQTLTHILVRDSIIDDYNNLASAYYELADIDDGTYVEADHADRVIDIEFGSPGGAASGYATQDSDGEYIVGCKVVLSESVLSSAEGYVGTLTHEIGHCMGLDHPMETTNAIMSYFVDENIIRLQVDDKMGLTYLYPENPDEVEETPTFGLACAPLD